MPPSAPERPRDAAALAPGSTIAGRYVVEEQIGEGGMGAVFRVRHQPSGQRLALKTLARGLLATREAVGRFEREAKATSALDHPNVVEMLDMGRLPDDGLFLVMELAEGPSIADLIAAGGVAPRRALVLVRQALDGLGYAHALGIVHRDLKPDNLVVVTVDQGHGPFERLKILDFGIAKLLGAAASELGSEKLTQTGMVSGTPGFMAPEQALGRPVDGRADLYALGAILFELLTARPPFEHPDAVALLRLHLSAPPPALAAVCPGAAWCTPAMERLVAGALAKSPEDRHAGADAMRAALDAAFGSIDHLPDPAA